MSEDNTEGAAAAAVVHELSCTALQRLSLLNLLLNCDIQKEQAAAVSTIVTVRGDWPRNRRLKSGLDAAGNPIEGVKDERDDPSPITLSEGERKFVVDFLKDFFDGSLERTVSAPMGGSRQEKIKPNGNDLVELMPLYDSLRHK